MDEKIAIRIITKYLKKGNMARCLRDILPSSNLSKIQREEIADIVHIIVRWKRFYDYIIDLRDLPRSAETYIKLAKKIIQSDATQYPFEYKYSCSSYVAKILKDHEDWAEYLNEKPPTTLCVNFNKSNLDTAIDLLHQEGLSAERSILPTALITTSRGRYSKVIQDHLAHIQDESSQLISFLASFLGNSLFDFCAGNGGKSLTIASLTKNAKKITAYDKNETKRNTLKRRCNEYEANVIVENHPSNKKYDLVLVDAPCSGLGAARRNPEAKYIEGVDDFPKIQVSLLKKAAKNVKLGGILFYAVCTITPEETIQVIENFIKNNNGFYIFNLEDFPYTNYLLRNTYGWFSLLPHGDLFFLCILKKEK